MEPRRTAGGRLRSGLTLLAEAALFGLGLAAVLADDEYSLVSLGLWNLMALVYLIAGGWYARHEPDDSATAERTPSDEGRLQRLEGRFRAFFPVLASLVGLVASLTILLTEDLAADQLVLLQALGVVTMLSAWLILHVGYARRYQWSYHRSGDQGLSFPDTDRPQLVDFLYFALTLGTTFATSDVSVTRRDLRWTVMVHSIVGFLYNAVVLAVAFKLITDA